MTRTRSRPGRALALATAALLAAVALAPATAGAQDRTALIVSLQLANTSRHSFQNDLQTNCNLFFSNGTSPEGNPQFATASGAPTGSLDFAQRKGEAFVKRTGWQREGRDFLQPPARAGRAAPADPRAAHAVRRHRSLAPGPQRLPHRAGHSR